MRINVDKELNTKYQVVYCLVFIFNLFFGNVFHICQIIVLMWQSNLFLISQFGII